MRLKEPNKNLLILCSASFSLSNFRGDLIQLLINENFKVYCAAPDFSDYTLELVKDLGGVPIPYNLQRTGLNPMKDFKTISELQGIIKKFNIDVVFPYTIKPVIYGSFAAKKLGVPMVSLITGLGFTFSQVNFKAKFLQWVTEFLYRRALRSNKAVIFQNTDDLQLFLDRKIVNRKQSLHVVDGSGVNLDKFQYKTRIHANDTAVKFVLVARLMKEKGVELFLDAAKKLKPEFPESQFHIIGQPPKNNASAISNEKLRQMHDNGTIIYHGKSNNVAKDIAELDVFVLPTFYREGVPRSILEALSSGMPIITTNEPGCRETVINDKNGFLIEAKKQEPLTQAMRYFLVNRDKIQLMGKNSRELAELKFDVNLINDKLLTIINTVV
ncbi:glycosyltransferase family 4 protein [Pareuzebyella sediminis]|uniref:glycosyltransferase family 4 protein n=1 Tax=Pareuzebyella sediminis TaxID=2607998 RepID=UPI0011EFE3DC|nr:glycosyltransferase family 4 protein [Pareuzebyella sediminis]